MSPFHNNVLGEASQGDGGDGGVVVSDGRRPSWGGVIGTRSVQVVSPSLY